MTELTMEVFERLLTKQLENFPTKRELDSLAAKKDLGALATKQELGAMATKKDLDSLATKKDLDLLATKKDLDGGIDDLAEMIQFLTKAAAYKDDLKSQSEHFDKRFAEQAVSLTFIESNVATLRKDLEQLSKRTKEDDGAFVKEILKLKNRMDQFEKQLKKLKAVCV